MFINVAFVDLVMLSNGQFKFGVRRSEFGVFEDIFPNTKLITPNDHFNLFWNLKELKRIAIPPKIARAVISGQRISSPIPFKKTPRMTIIKYRSGLIYVMYCSH